MIILVTIIHVLVCLFLIVVVLLQSGKAGDISAAFGGQPTWCGYGSLQSHYDFGRFVHVDLGDAFR